MIDIKNLLNKYVDGCLIKKVDVLLDIWLILARVKRK